MTDFLAELNRVMDRLASEPDVAATSLAGDLSTYLVLSDDPTKYVASDAWAADFDAVLLNPQKYGSLMRRACRLAGADITFLFGNTSWATELLTAEDRDIAAHLTEIHDPRGVIRGLMATSLTQRVEFASTEEIATYGDVSSDFFRIIGLGEALFISDSSTLSDWCESSGVSLEHANARIHEVYGVDVSDLYDGRLVDVFERIRQGDCYRSWRAEHDG